MGDQEKAGTAVGATFGCVAGAVILTALAGRRAAGAGCAAGAVAGGITGNRLGKAFDDRDKRLKELAASNGVQVATEVLEPKTGDISEEQLVIQTESPKTQADIGRLKDRAIYAANIQMDEQFPVGSSRMTPKASKFFEEVAATYKQTGKRLVLIVGHTDNEGADALNQSLSEARAHEVGKVFVARGFSKAEIFYQGAGATEPIASNLSAEGRAKNRRVEIVDAANRNGLLLYKNVKAVKSYKEKDSEIKKQPFPEQEDRRKENAKIHVVNNVPGARRDIVGIDFGGVLLAQDSWPEVVPRTATITTEQTWKDKLISILPVAHAAPMVSTIFEDEVATSGPVKSMAGGEQPLYKPSDHMPGYYRQPLYGYVGKHFVDLTPVSILGNGTAGEMADMRIYLDYDFRKETKSKQTTRPSYTIKGACRTYSNQNVLLYRWKAAENKEGVVGVDVALPIQSEATLQDKEYIESSGKLYYQRNGEYYVQKVDLKIAVLGTNIKWRP